mmetsp:Transcript_13253/g.44778  ORF Transcript_13253/g.44778 Transcript_13253/m.44778 type:complete len:163 (+) Transcript_13253:116-604(+)
MRFLAALLALSATAVAAQQEIRIESREQLVALLSMLSPECSGQVQAASADPSQQQPISQPCHAEISAALAELQDPLIEAEPEAPTGDADPASKPPPSAPKPAPSGFMSPWVGIVLFLVLLFGSVAGYVVVVNRILDEKMPRKPKKPLSKKKQLKERQKAKQR